MTDAWRLPDGAEAASTGDAASSVSRLVARARDHFDDEPRRRFLIQVIRDLVRLRRTSQLDAAEIVADVRSRQRFQRLSPTQRDFLEELATAEAGELDDLLVLIEAGSPA